MAEIELAVDDSAGNATASEVFLLTVRDVNEPRSDTPPPTTRETRASGRSPTR
jgi:hypothetical protein